MDEEMECEEKDIDEGDDNDDSDDEGLRRSKRLAEKRLKQRQRACGTSRIRDVQRILFH